MKDYILYYWQTVVKPAKKRAEKERAEKERTKPVDTELQVQQPTF